MSKELDTIKYLLEQCPNETIKKALLDVETELKDYENLQNKYDELFNNHAIKLTVLEIISEKRVNVFWLMECISCYTNALERYNEEVLDKDIDCLTQEEFDLLKEMLP